MKTLASIAFLLAGVSVLPVEAEEQKTVSEAWKDLQEAVRADDAKAIWACLSDSAKLVLMDGKFRKWVADLQRESDSELEWLAKLAGTTPQALRAMRPDDFGRELFVAEFRRSREDVLAGTIVESREDRDLAQVTFEVRRKDGTSRREVVTLERESGTWKLGRKTFEVRRGIEKCRDHLKQLGVYVALYQAKYSANPGSWDDLKSIDLLREESLLTCPLAPAGRGTYIYLFPVDGDLSTDDTINGYDSVPHADDSVCVMEFCGRVTRLDGEVFRARLKKQLTESARKIPAAIKRRQEEMKDAALDRQARLKKEIKGLESLTEEVKKLDQRD